MGDDDDNGNGKSYESDSSTWDFGGDETQIFDSQFSNSPVSSPGNKFNLENTIPYDYHDMAMLQAEFETEVVEPDDETQVMEPDDETQLANLGGETQVVNFDTEFEEMDISDSADQNGTQLFNDFDTEEVVTDHEGTEKTEVVDDSDEFSDGDSGRRECANSTDLEHTQIVHQCKEDIKECKSKIDNGKSEHLTSGVGFKTFTSTRAASLRASGLAALSKASKRSKSPSCPTLNSEPDTEHRRILFERSQSHEKVNSLTDGPETGNRSRFGRSTARKLFADDAFTETNEVNVKIDLNGPTELAGLSYNNSQEPGDASQAYALDFVDNFLKINIESGNECDTSKSTGEKSKPVLSAKGTRTFAESSSLINAVDKRRIFDWDDNFEDEGGGELFCKKKEVFFASGGLRVKPSSKSGRKVTGSDSKLVLGKNKENDKSKKSLGTRLKNVSFQKNLVSELDKQITDMPAGMNIQETVEEAIEDRFDTQMAAEAMEDLCFGLQDNDHDSTKADVGGSCMQKGSRKSQTLPVSNDGVRTRSKSKRTRGQSTGVKRSNPGAKKNVVGSESETLNDVASDVQKRSGRPLKRREVDTVDASVASVDKVSVKKQCIENVIPVAQRTRKSIKDNEFENVKNIILTGFYPKGKRTPQKLSLRQKAGTQSSSRLTRSKAAILDEQEKGHEKLEPDRSACTTPVSLRTPVKESSPICMGDEYLKQSCKRPSLIKEVCGLYATGSFVRSPNKDSRQRRDVSLIRVLFSRHLDGDIIKQQKKILSRLGASESSSMSDATHFIADDFVRTKNMLEAIGLGKPVVTHFWLESCGQACCHIDEKNFILRDLKKEKEFAFTLSASLTRARQNPLLEGHKVLITPNTKPGKEILSSLVKAVNGVMVERMGRSSKNYEGLLVLSCEEDYGVCLPFLEKGTAIYSSELLLNGIVTQRLEYERHLLFLDHVKRTRSTVWLKKDDNQFKPIGNVK